MPVWNDLIMNVSYLLIEPRIWVSASDAILMTGSTTGGVTRNVEM